MASHARPKSPPPTSTPTLVLIVRHGRTPTTGSILPGRAKGLKLSDEGAVQADAVAKRIASSFNDVAAIYSSPLERCKETAAPIARELGLKVQTDKGLIECDFGDWTGRKLKELARLPEWQIVQRNPAGFRFPGGESFLEMQARVHGTVTELASEHAGEKIVLVSHADPIKVALVSALGMPLDQFQRLNISPCSVSAVLYGQTGASVLAVNVMDNLVDLQPS